MTVSYNREMELGEIYLSLLCWEHNSADEFITDIAKWLGPGVSSLWGSKFT